MATPLTATPVQYKTPTEVLGVSVDMRSKLRQGELLTGTPTITVTGPTASSPAVSTSPLLINGDTVEAGKAVTFTVSGGSANTTYSIHVSCGTSASQTVETYLSLTVDNE